MTQPVLDAGALGAAPGSRRVCRSHARRGSAARLGRLGEAHEAAKLQQLSVRSSTTRRHAQAWLPQRRMTGANPALLYPTYSDSTFFYDPSQDRAAYSGSGADQLEGESWRGGGNGAMNGVGVSIVLLLLQGGCALRGRAALADRVGLRCSCTRSRRCRTTFRKAWASTTLG